MKYFMLFTLLLFSCVTYAQDDSKWKEVASSSKEIDVMYQFLTCGKGEILVLKISNNTEQRIDINMEIKISDNKGKEILRDVNCSLTPNQILQGNCVATFAAKDVRISPKPNQQFGLEDKLVLHSLKITHQ